MLEAEVVAPLVTPPGSKLLHQLEKCVARMPLMQVTALCMRQLPDSILAALMQLKSEMPPPLVLAGWHQSVLV